MLHLTWRCKERANIRVDLYIKLLCLCIFSNICSIIAQKMVMPWICTGLVHEVSEICISFSNCFKGVSWLSSWKNRLGGCVWRDAKALEWVLPSITFQCNVYHKSRMLGKAVYFRKLIDLLVSSNIRGSTDVYPLKKQEIFISTKTLWLLVVHCMNTYKYNCFYMRLCNTQAWLGNIYDHCNSGQTNKNSRAMFRAGHRMTLPS